ncbi:hypothetical protein D9M73_182480 [compost metagenome]
MRELGAQGVDHLGGVVHRQGGLGHVVQLLGVAYLEGGDVLLVFNQVDVAAIGRVVLAHGAFHFRVAFVADEDAFVAVAAVAHDFHVHLGDQRAGGVEHLQAAILGFLAHGLGNAVGTEDDDGVIRHLVQLFDEDGATITQVFHHELVVHDFVAHVDRRAEHVQRAVDDLDRAVNAGAEAAGVGEFDLHDGISRRAGKIASVLRNFDGYRFARPILRGTRRLG